MSRVHDALRRAEAVWNSVATRPPRALERGVTPAAAAAATPTLPLQEILEKAPTIQFTPSPEASLLDTNRPHGAPMEEFRTLRTRLNHLQGLQPIHTLVITSPSPAEGKSFTAANLCIAQSHLEGNQVLLADFDFRRPVIHQLFQIERTPGITDYLQGKVSLEEVLLKVEGTNLCILPAGEAVTNPLELLNLPEAKNLLRDLPQMFNWVVLDTPPLLFAADANLLSTLCDGTVMVVRIGATTIDSVTRAIQSLCQNNILGIVVNCARRSELYHKYTYYHSYYYAKSGGEAGVAEGEVVASEAPESPESTKEKS